jgi:hypothetical protein
MYETLVDQQRAVEGMRSDGRMTGWKADLREDLEETFRGGAGRWSRAIAAVAWIHLAGFMICQALYDPSSQRDPRLLLVWAGELVAVLSALRTIVGPGWMRSSPAVGVVTRLWGTFLILSFNLVMLNALVGWESRWYKPAWGTLSTFFLASLAWLFSYRLFIPAVQLSFTALLMVRFRDQENLIYGLSWWLVLLGIARRIGRRERADIGSDPVGAI